MAEPSDATGQAPSGKVLAVGHPDTMDALEAPLIEAGFHVARGRIGTQARAAFANNPPDLLLLDFHLRDSSALELCRDFKSDARTMHIPVVFVSDSAADSARTEGLESGCDDFLCTPIDTATVGARVRALIAWKQRREDLQAQRGKLEAEKLASLRGTFERYVSPKLVERILSARRQGDTVMADQKSRREVVALFADMRGFTRVSETLLPLEVVHLLNRFFTVLADIAHRHEGTVFNMSGDCLLVGFGVPFSRPDAAREAVYAACEMVTELAPVMDSWRREFDVELDVGIGLNKGDVIAGNIGSPSYISYTIIGDAVNIAARLMQMAGPGEIVCAESVYASIDAVPEDFVCEAIGSVHMKGKVDTIAAYKLRMRAPASDGEIALDSGGGLPAAR